MLFIEYVALSSVQDDKREREREREREGERLYLPTVLLRLFKPLKKRTQFLLILLTGFNRFVFTYSMCQKLSQHYSKADLKCVMLMELSDQKSTVFNKQCLQNEPHQPQCPLNKLQTLIRIVKQSSGGLGFGTVLRRLHFSTHNQWTVLINLVSFAATNNENFTALGRYFANPAVVRV